MLISTIGLIFTIVLILIGILFIGFGYFIYFKKKYSLINNYEEDKRLNIFDETYAKRVGLIELIGGLVCVVLGIVAIFLNYIFAILVLVLSISSICSALVINFVKSSNRAR